jgi:glycosyltransferase involved in cell wall biosynthesis
LFDAVDICVFSSRYEPFGTVFVQAWAMDTPLITTNADGPSQYVRDGIDGLVVPVDNIEEMKAAIARLAADKALKNQLVAEGRKRYVSEFTKENTVRMYLELYHSLKNTPPANL